MLDGLSRLIESFSRLTSIPLLAIGLGTGFILFTPESFAETTGAAEFRDSNRGYLGVAFYVSWSYLLAYVIIGGGKKTIAKLAHLSKLRAARQYLHELTNQEKGYLRLYIENGTVSQKLPIDDGVVIGLMRRGILSQGNTLGDILRGCPWNLEPWAKDYLKRNPSLLEGALVPPRPNHRGTFT